MIDYNLLNLALDFYEKKGYRRVEVPWMVTEDIDAITRPKQATPLEVKPKNKNLIASGEQGFLYQTLKGYLPTGKYIERWNLKLKDLKDFSDKTKSAFIEGKR